MPNGCPPGSRRYTIAAGDTLFSLAQRFGTTVSAITSLNPGIDPNRLVGRVIIPGRRSWVGPCPLGCVMPSGQDALSPLPKEQAPLSRSDQQ